MLTKIIAGIICVIVLGGCVFAWWMENGPSKEDDNIVDEENTPEKSTEEKNQ